ncbi:aspartic peptidase domain-containing protein [Mycena vulgaris]|nr:aspartic peptidase domain-containing protein [Mycena vulgaris]
MHLLDCLLLLTVSAAVVASPHSLNRRVSTAGPVHFPLVRRTGRPISPSNYLSTADQLRVRYGFASSETSSGKDKFPRRDLNLVDQADDSVYLANIEIGTPPQTVAVMLSSGSADLWVAQSPCSDCPGSSTLYDSAASSTFSQDSSNTTTISYSSGERVSGPIAQETVRIGPYTVTSQAFLKVNDASSGTLVGSEAGILGLGFGAIASTTKVPFWQAALAQAPVPEMAIWLKRGAQNESIGGSFTFGGTNSSLFVGNIEFLNSATDPSTTGFWELNVSGITVQGKGVDITSGVSALSAIDTGTTLIGGPGVDVAAIWAAVPGATPSTSMSGFYEFPCTTKVNITVAFGGKSWPINPADINVGNTSNNACLGAIYALSETVSPSGPNWVFGIAFLKNVYTVFRQVPPSVGFAQLSALTNDPSPTSAGTLSGSGSFSTSTSTSSSLVPSQTSAGPGKKKSNIGPIVGGVFAGLVAILIGFWVWLYSRRQRMTDREDRTQITAFPSLLPDQTRAEGPVSSKRQPVMGTLLNMKREQVAAVHRYDDTYTATDAIASTERGLQLTPGRAVGAESAQNSRSTLDVERIEAAQASVDVLSSGRGGSGVTDPVLNELRNLRAEMHRLIADRVRPDAPPSYVGHDGGED